MANTTKTRSRSFHTKVSNTITYIVLILMSIIWLFPFVGLVFQSFRSYATEYGGMVSYIIPKVFSWDNYTYLFSEECSFVRWYLNTLIIAFSVAVLNTIMILCVAYALSRSRFKGRTFMMQLWLILGMSLSVGFKLNPFSSKETLIPFIIIPPRKNIFFIFL